jgi:hypothetical protein
MAGLGRRTFAPGEVLTASNVMNYLQDQVVQNFAGTAARGSAIGTAVSEGMVSYLQDTNSLEVYKTVGTAVAGWEPVNLAQSPNVIINGAMDFWQRGTSFTTNGVYTADRWQMGFGGSGTSQTTSQVAFTVGNTIAGQEPQFHLRAAVTGGSGTSSLAVLSQPIEDVRTFAGQTVTFSFWARAASGTPSLGFDFFQSFGSGGSSTVGGIGAGKVTLSTSWARYSATVAVPSISGKTVGTGSALVFRLWFSSGSDYNDLNNSLGIQSNTFDLWGVQVEAGQTATPFRRNANSIQGELAACQRYYLSVPDETLVIQSTVQFQATLFPTTMRAAPTVTIIGTSGGGSVAVSVTTTHGFFTSNSGMTAAIGFTASIEL